MSYLDDIGAYLQSQSLGTLGTNLFLGALYDNPQIPDAATALLPAQGLSPVIVHQAVADAVDQPQLYVLCRGAVYNFQEPHGRIQAIYAALHNVVNLTLSGTRYLGIVAAGTPLSLGPDDQFRPLLACTFQVWRPR